jgi:hypothetical protein
MITIDRLSLPTDYAPKVGDLLQIEQISGGSRGRWQFKVKLVQPDQARHIFERLNEPCPHGTLTADTSKANCGECPQCMAEFEKELKPVSKEAER